MIYLFKTLIFMSFLIIVLECFSDVIVNNNKLNLTVYNELLLNKNSTLYPIRNVIKSNTSNSKTKKSFQSGNLITKNNFYQNITPNPISVLKDYLITKHNYRQPSVVSSNNVITVNDGASNSDYNQNNINYLDSQITQTNLLNFLNISNPTITSTESALYEESIEVPEISRYEISNRPNYYTSKPMSPHVIYNTHQYYDFLNYAPPIGDKFMTTQIPPLNQIKATTISPKITTTRTTNQNIKNTYDNEEESVEKTTVPKNKPNHHQKPATSTPVFIMTYPNKHKKPVRRGQQKRRKPIKDKYVLTESPVVVAVEDTLESVYNYFEELFTDTVQYPAHEEFETVEIESQSMESHKYNPRKNKRKKIYKSKEQQKPVVYTTLIPLPYIASHEYDSSDTSDDSSSSEKENDSNSESDSASSEEYSKKTLRTIIPTKSSAKLKTLHTSKPIKTQFLKLNRTTTKPKHNLNKSNIKRITVRSLNTQTNKAFTTPLSINADRKTTRKSSIGTRNSLVKHLHITKEFIESTTAVNLKLNRTNDKKVLYDSNESFTDYVDDYFDFDDDDDDYETNNLRLASTNPKIKKEEMINANKKKFVPKESNENYYDEYDSIFALPPISNLLPTLHDFNNDETPNEVFGRSTTPNNVYSDSKFPYKSATRYQHESNKQNKPMFWYSPMFDVDEEPTTAMNLQMPSISESSHWFQSWFSDSNEIVTENPTTTTESSTAAKWWYPFSWNENEEDGDTITMTTTQFPTTTRKLSTRPLLVIPNPMPESFITFLTEKIKPKPTKAAELENSNTKIHYDQYQLWRLFPQSTGDVATLEEYRMSFEDSADVQWWKGPALRSTTEILVSPNMTEEVKEFLNEEYIKYEIIMKSIQTAILYENPKISNHEKLQIEIHQGHPLTWHRYHSYDDIIKFLENLQRRHPDNVELIHMGRSYEGRPLIIVKVHFDDMILENSKNLTKSKPKFIKEKLKKRKKKGIFIECGVHGREWMSPAVGTWILNNLMNLILQNNTIGETVRSVDWYVLPVMNPDGYQFSFEFDRFWRKTRSNHKRNSFNLLYAAFNWMKPSHTEKTCYGVDPSRNWAVNWGTKGASQSKCSEFYMGPESNSEPEIKALSKFLMEYRKKIKLFLSLHSYGQFISYPEMSNSTYTGNEIHDVLDMALTAIESLRNSDSAKRYKVDTTNDMMSLRSGTSESFAMHEAGIKYCYIMELRDTGHHGFLVPASYIESTAKATFEMIKAMVGYL